jgi:site-specific DNA recombinase
MMKAVGYVRVSTDQQADGGESLRLQETKIRAMAEVQGAELSEVVVDAGESAKSLRRPGMSRLLSLVASGSVDAVIVLKLDRLTRSVRDLADLLDTFDRKGVSLVAVSESLDTGTAAGRLVLNIMASVGQWEREAIGERTREALASMKARGLRVGNVAFGFTLAADGVSLVECPEEQRVIEIVVELRQDGRSLRAIADELNRQGYSTRRGSAWLHQYVAAIAKEAA